jgi:hypothetical protein
LLDTIESLPDDARRGLPDLVASLAAGESEARRSAEATKTSCLASGRTLSICSTVRG